jgi:hypothetical protein
MAIQLLKPYATTELSKLLKPVPRLNIFTLKDPLNSTVLSAIQICALKASFL